MVSSLLSLLSHLFGSRIPQPLFGLFLLASFLSWLLEQPRRVAAWLRGCPPTVEVRPVLLRCKPFAWDDNRARHFLTLPGEKVSPSWLLSQPLSLIQLSPTRADFALLPAPLSHYHPSKHTFVIEGAFADATAIVRVPMEILLNLSEELGDLEPELCLISNTGRCGSTLLAKQAGALAHPSDTLVLSEDNTFEALDALQRYHRLSDKVMFPVVRAVLKVLFNKRNLRRIVIKHRFYSIRMALLAYRSLPGRVKHVFIERRDIYAGFMSMYKFFGTMGHVIVCTWAAQFLWQIKKRLIPKPPAKGALDFNICRLMARTRRLQSRPEIVDAADRLMLPSMLEWMVGFWADTLLCYKDAEPVMGESNLHIVFEDLIGDPSKELSRFAHHFGDRKSVV